MITPSLRCAALVGLALLLAGERPAVAQDEAPGPAAPRTLTSAEWKKLRKLLPKYLWLKDERKRRKAKVDAAWQEFGAGAVVLDRKRFDELGALLRAGSPYTTVKKRGVTLDIQTGATLDDGADESMPVRVSVTTKYKPGCGRSFPLIITCHGGPASELPMATKGARTQYDLWARFTSTNECIVAAPALTGGKYGEREWTFFTNLIDELDATYNVDRDRILLTGHSWGGIMTWHMGPAHADSFALLAPFVCAVNPGREHLTNLRALPVYHVQGDRDMKWMLDSGRERRDLLDDLGYEHWYREPNGGHETFGTEIARIAKLFVERSRDLYANQIARRPTYAGGPSSDDWYWLRTPARSFDATIDAETRTIDVDVDGPFEVFLSDDMLDLDEPVHITRQGETVYEGRVERRLDFALEHVRETGDRARVFAASVRIE